MASNDDKEVVDDDNSNSKRSHVVYDGRGEQNVYKLLIG
jgi:hypothetical protein